MGKRKTKSTGAATPAAPATAAAPVAYGYVDDEYLEAATIPERPGVHPELTFHFRPMSEIDGVKFNARIKQLEDEEAGKTVEYIGEVFARHIRSWNLKGRKGGPDATEFDVNPAVPAVYASLKTPLLEAIMDEVRGDAALQREAESQKNSSTP